MKILFLSSWYPYPTDNGSKLRVYHLLRSLCQKHEVTLLSFAFDTARYEQDNELLEMCTAIRTVPVNPFAYRQVAVWRRFLSPRPAFTRPIPSMAKLVRDALMDNPFDTIVASVETMSGYAFQAPPGVMRVLEEHNSLTRWMRERYERHQSPLAKARCWVSWQKTMRFEAGLFRQFDLTTMVSSQDCDFSRALLPVADRGRIEVVPNGVDCRHNRPGLVTPRPGALVYNGSLTYEANYDAMQYFLSEIYPIIKQRIPNATLAITGTTTGVNLAGLALDDTVRLTGMVDDVRYPVAAACVCVAPIRQGGGTRLKILEAMALGTPVVATKKAIEGLNVTADEHLLVGDDAYSFAQHTIRLLSDAPLRMRLSNCARKLVEEAYDWTGIGASFVHLVENTHHNMETRHHDKSFR